MGPWVKVFAHQIPALEEIVARGRAYFQGEWRHPSLRRIKPRFSSLVVGGTGVGKTALATIAGETLNAPLVRISTPAWIPVGAHNRGATETLVMIADHVTRNPRTLLVLDEIDKICAHGRGSGQDAWLAYIRGEIMDLVDGRWPGGLRIPADDDDEEPPDAKGLAERLTTKLRNTVFIIGIGTFQDFFDSVGTRRTMGFVTDDDESLSEISAVTVAERLPRELANRFNSNLIRLPELRPADYQTIAQETADSLPEHIRAPFLAAAIRQIPGAIAAKKGVRFLEEAMLDTLKNLPPEAAPLSAPMPSPLPTTEPPNLECIL
jgi:SpoVK/Ycf46/Vps4 family AAA+-type ATPase